MFREIKSSLQHLYWEDERPWLVGFSGGKDSTMLTSLIFDAVLAIPSEQRKKPISILCTDTRVEIPVIPADLARLPPTDDIQSGGRENWRAHGLIHGKLCKATRLRRGRQWSKMSPPEMLVRRRTGSCASSGSSMK